MMSSIIWQVPSVFYLLLGVPLAILFFVWREVVRNQRLRRLGDLQLIDLLKQRVSHRRRIVKFVLWNLVYVMLVVALARPMWGFSIMQLDLQGVSVFIVLDISQSMDAEDILPSRLERAKIDIRDLVQQLVGNEIGLVAFAGSPFVVFPLTTDINATQTYLNYLSSISISRQGTSIDSAIQLALNSFTQDQSKQGVIVLVTDGEDPSEVFDNAITAAVNASVPIHVLAYGTVEGDVIPIRLGNGALAGNKRDRFGNIVITKLNEDGLRDIAEETGGIYLSLLSSQEDITQLANLINASNSSPLGTQQNSRYVERFWIFALFALLILSIEMLLSETR